MVPVPKSKIRDQFCVPAGFTHAVLWVFADNGHARGFYERRGWTPDGATGAAAGAAELRYRKDLRR